MARSIIGSRWTPLQRNELNRMLTELYDAVGFITEGTITPEMIANGSITGSKLANGSIYGDKIADNSIEDGKLKENTVGGRELKDGAILNSKYATRSITWDKLDEGAVTGSRIADGAVTSVKTNFDSLTLNKGKDFPMLSLNSFNVYWRNGFLDVKVNNAEEGALYRLSHVSKDNTAWGAAVTFIEIGKSVNDGATWNVIIARNQANVPNGQTGIKTHAITKDGIEEIITVTLDWDVFMTGSTNSTLNSAEYIISPINYIYAPKEEEATEYDPPYLRNAGKVYPFVNKGTTDNVFYKNSILDMKVQRAEDNAIYRLEHISKDNTSWGNPLTFFQFQRSFNDGVEWQTMTDRTNSALPNNQTGVKTHIISHSGINEMFTITIDWDALNHPTLKHFNIGAAQYIIDPNLYFFSRSSNSNVVNLEENIVVKRNGRQLQIKQPYDADNNMIVEYNSIGINEYHEFKAFYLQPKSSSYADFTGTEIMRNGTDWISPYGMRVVNNPVSNNAGSITVGGAHGTTGGSGFPTGRFSRLYDFKLDGNAVGNGIHVGKKINITAEHYVSASNAVNKDTGTKRDTAIERRFYTIKPRSHSVTVSVEALEDLTLTHYAGFMIPQMSQVFDTFYLHDVADDLGLLPAGGLENGIYHTVDKDYSKIDRAVLVNDKMLLVMLTDRTFGIGTGEFAPESTEDRPQSPILYTGGQFGKIGAHNLGGSSNDYLLKAGETISYRGGYHFVEKLGDRVIDVEDKLIHANHWINFQGVLSARPNNDLSVYGPFDYLEGLSMNSANYVSYYDADGEFITTNNTSEVDNFKIPHIDNAATFKLSLWHDKLSDFKLIKHEIDNVFEYEIDGVTHTDDLRVV